MNRLPARIAAAIAPALAGLILAAAPAGAAERPQGWQTWTWDASCYAIVYAEPNGEAPGMGNDRAYIAVKHVPREKTYDGVTIASGMQLPGDAEGTVEVNGREYPMLVFKGAGFVRAGDPERSLVEGLAKSGEAKVTWVTKDGMTIQTYKVGGFAAAHKVIDAACPRSGASAEAAPPDEPKAAAKPARRRARG